MIKICKTLFSKYKVNNCDNSIDRIEWSSLNC